jgi:hypothetical protein
VRGGVNGLQAYDILNKAIGAFAKTCKVVVIPFFPLKERGSQVSILNYKLEKIEPSNSTQYIPLDLACIARVFNELPMGAAKLSINEICSK